MTGVVIAGGGLAGLSAALLLNRYGFEVTVIEKKTYPFNKVCGEYVSNEVLPYLQSFGISFNELNPPRLTKLALTSVSGNKVSVGLGLGGFGLSRYQFDKILYDKAIEMGVKFLTGSKVNGITFADNRSVIILADNTILEADVVIAAYGKRSNLDQKLERSFFLKKSPYLGIKYHIRTDFPADLIQLDNFAGGYCGICRIEDDKYSLCYLVNNQKLKEHSSIQKLEENVLFKNPYIKRYFKESEFLNERPQVINEISFSRKSLVEDHILFCGDAAGMITPLCGNGMAMAIHSGKILAETIYKHLQHDRNLKDRKTLEETYKKSWKQHFAWRIFTGRLAQRLFLQPGISSMGIGFFKTFPAVLRSLVKKTHGSSF